MHEVCLPRHMQDALTTIVVIVVTIVVVLDLVLETD